MFVLRENEKSEINTYIIMSFGISHIWIWILFWSLSDSVALRKLFNPFECQVHGQYKCNLKPTLQGYG